MEKNKSDILFGKRFILGLFFAWLIFIAVDFVAHASLLKNLWVAEAQNLKSKEELFKHIPEGYFSFLVLSFMVIISYRLVFYEDPGLRKTFLFGLIAGFLFSLSQLFALHSFILLSFYFLLIIYLVYWIEIVTVVLIFRYVYYSQKKRQPILSMTLLFILLIIIGIVAQNVI
jgi:hypothetical protein